MKTFKAKAIVLRRTNYGEADRILSMLTPERGKISAIAKGVRKPKSKLAGGLELLALCDVTFIEGRGAMARITSARLDTFYSNILADFDRLEFAYACIKRISGATESVESPEFFDLLLSTLESLNNLGINKRLIALCFNLQFGAQFGQSLNLITDRDGQKLSAGKNYNYDPEENVFYGHERGDLNESHIKLLRLAAAKSPAVLARVSGLGEVLDKCLTLSEAVTNF